ncbi:hypothetical protein E1B28_001719 [Marasmius oreades]|nr:uncharacterized protein E1B28_001719 [Marasmius oreades]KAG7099925.1 hypothetical protein E1B28_001719 [Marasmius oreades]
MSPKSILITGSSAGGLGGELAKQFHARGFFVIATARNLDSMQELTALGITTLQQDVIDEKSIQVIKAKVTELTDGKLDILINNAGVSYPYAAADISLQTARAVYEVNLFSVMAMVQAFLPLLIASGDARIVNMGSTAAVAPVPFGCVYNSSKAALHSYSDTLRIELAPFNIKVITIVPGLFTSNLTKPWHRVPEGSIYTPIAQQYKERRIEKFTDGAMPRDEITRNIIDQVLKSSPRAWYWDGTNSWLIWFLGTFGGRKAFDGILSRKFGLADLAQIRQAEQTKRSA